MQDADPARRFDRLPTEVVGGVEVPVATSRGARLLGLAHLDRSAAGPGLLIPRCRSVHTFGMRFALDLVFLDREGGVLAERRGVSSRRLVREPQIGVWAVLELPSRGRDRPAARLGLGHASRTP